MSTSKVTRSTVGSMDVSEMRQRILSCGKEGWEEVEPSGRRLKVFREEMVAADVLNEIYRFLPFATASGKQTRWLAENGIFVEVLDGEIRGHKYPRGRFIVVVMDSDDVDEPNPLAAAARRAVDAISSNPVGDPEASVGSGNVPEVDAVADVDHDLDEEESVEEEVDVEGVCTGILEFVEEVASMISEEENRLVRSGCLIEDQYRWRQVSERVHRQHRRTIRRLSSMRLLLLAFQFHSVESVNRSVYKMVNRLEEGANFPGMDGENVETIRLLLENIRLEIQPLARTNPSLCLGEHRRAPMLENNGDADAETDADVDPPSNVFGEKEGHPQKVDPSMFLGDAGHHSQKPQHATIPTASSPIPKEPPMPALVFRQVPRVAPLSPPEEQEVLDAINSMDIRTGGRGEMLGIFRLYLPHLDWDAVLAFLELLKGDNKIMVYEEQIYKINGI